MPGELKPRRRRRGGRGRGRRRGGANKTQIAAQPVEGSPAGVVMAPAAGLTPVEISEPVWAGEDSFVPLAPAADPAAGDVFDFEPRDTQPVAVEVEAGHNGGGATGATVAEESPARGRRRKRGARGRRSRREPRGRRGRLAAAPALPAEGGTVEAAALAEPAEGVVVDIAPARPERHERHERPERTHREQQDRAVEKTIVINAAPQETRVAILEKGVLAEIFIERESMRTVVGNVYKGRVTKVLPGMQSAFVNITLERDAFLYVSDISPGYDAYEGLLDLDEVEGGEAIRDAAPRVNREAKIEDLIKEGQELLVQVTKEPIGTKGARITSYVTLPGRFLVLMPQVDHVGVSRKIGDARERARLRKILDKVRVPGMGFIVRTVAEGCDATELEADANYLAALWEEIRHKAEKVNAAAEVHRELSVVPKVLRDLLNHSVSKVYVDDEATY